MLDYSHYQSSTFHRNCQVYSNDAEQFHFMVQINAMKLNLPNNEEGDNVTMFLFCVNYQFRTLVINIANLTAVGSYTEDVR